MSTAEKLTYLNDTKEDLKEIINYTGANIGTNDTFRSYASKLKQGYLDILNNGIDTLYNNFPKVSGIGSNLSLTPTYKAPIKLNEIQGNTLQNGTPTPSSPVPIQSVTGLQNVTICGKNLLDTSKMVTFQGTVADRWWWIDGIYAVNQSTLTYKVQAGTTYTFSIKEKTNCGTVQGIYNINGTESQAFIINDGGTSATFTPSTTTNVYVRCKIILANTDTYCIGQLEKGSSATTYEPYKGNTYEVNLGKNLYDPSFRTSNDTIYCGSGTATETNGIFSLTATGSDLFMWQVVNNGNDYTQNAGQLFEFESNNYSVTITNDLFKKNYVTYYDENKKSIRYSNKSTNIFTISKSDEPTAKYFSLRIGNGSATSGTTYSLSVQLEKGNTTSYSPYFTPIELNSIPETEYEDSIKKSTGKNLFNATLDRYATNRVRTNVYSVLPNTTYTISVGTSGISVVNYYKDINQSDISDSGLKSMPYTFTTPSNCYYIQQIIRKSDDSNITLDELSTIMLNEGSTALPYEPYGKVWYVYKAIGKIVLNNTLNWQKSTTYSTDTYTMFFYNNEGLFVQNADGNCNRFEWGNTGDVRTGNKECVGNAGNSINIRILKSRLDTNDTNGLKTWLSNNDTIAYFILKKPTYEVITNTELIEDLESLYNAKSQDGTTNINVTSEDLSMILNVGVLKGE